MDDLSPSQALGLFVLFFFIVHVSAIAVVIRARSGLHPYYRVSQFSVRLAWLEMQRPIFFLTEVCSFFRAIVVSRVHDNIHVPRL